MPSGLTSTSSCTVGASSVSDCSGVKDMLPRPWYERVQSIAGTPSTSGGASDKPSVKERWERASAAADSAVLFRYVGTGGSAAGNEGLTTRWAVDEALEADVVEDAGFAAVAVVPVAGFVVVVVVGAALDGVTHAARLVEDEMVRWDIRYAVGAALDGDAEMRAEKPLLADDIAMLFVQWVVPSIRNACRLQLTPQREVTISGRLGSMTSRPISGQRSSLATPRCPARPATITVAQEHL